MESIPAILVTLRRVTLDEAAVLEVAVLEALQISTPRIALRMSSVSEDGAREIWVRPLDKNVAQEVPLASSTNLLNIPPLQLRDAGFDPWEGEDLCVRRRRTWTGLLQAAGEDDATVLGSPIAVDEVWREDPGCKLMDGQRHRLSTEGTHAQVRELHSSKLLGGLRVSLHLPHHRRARFEDCGALALQHLCEAQEPGVHGGALHENGAHPLHQRSHEHIGLPGDPPSGAQRQDCVLARLGIEHVLHRARHPIDIATVCVHDALGLASRARGVGHEKRMV
mmetsp:Transcript_78175/g.175222  ORF Transcript_78175/g.175222 Transcript_78175/m.175222 type:complete len:279 (+) Transcript_78175:2094-2930(+)